MRGLKGLGKFETRKLLRTFPEFSRCSGVTGLLLGFYLDRIASSFSKPVRSVEITGLGLSVKEGPHLRERSDSRRLGKLGEQKLRESA